MDDLERQAKTAQYFATYNAALETCRLKSERDDAEIAAKQRIIDAQEGMIADLQERLRAADMAVQRAIDNTPGDGDKTIGDV